MRRNEIKQRSVGKIFWVREQYIQIPKTGWSSEMPRSSRTPLCLDPGGEK